MRYMIPPTSTLARLSEPKRWPDHNGSFPGIMVLKYENQGWKKTSNRKPWEAVAFFSLIALVFGSIYSESNRSSKALLNLGGAPSSLSRRTRMISTPFQSTRRHALSESRITRIPMVVDAKKTKVWGKLRHNTRSTVKWIPKTEEMTFQVIGEKEHFSPENLVSFIEEWFIKYPNSEVHIGADSKKRGATTSYVIGICLYHRGHGGTVLYHRKVVPTVGSNLERLWIELEIAMEVSNYLRDHIGPEPNINVHVDYNPEPMYKVSNALYSSGMAWIKSSGFNGIAKPNAWAASSVADKLT